MVRHRTFCWILFSFIFSIGCCCVVGVSNVKPIPYYYGGSAMVVSFGFIETLLFGGCTYNKVTTATTALDLSRQSDSLKIPRGAHGRGPPILSHVKYYILATPTFIPCWLDIGWRLYRGICIVTGWTVPRSGRLGRVGGGTRAAVVLITTVSGSLGLAHLGECDRGGKLWPPILGITSKGGAHGCGRGN